VAKREIRGSLLKADDILSEARSSIGRRLAFYNQRRPHSSLDRRAPNEAHFMPSPLAAAALIFRRRLTCLRSGANPHRDTMKVLADRRLRANAASQAV
jgi:hypothetical protein